MLYSDYCKHIERNCTKRVTDKYTVIFRKLSDTELYIEQVFIQPEFQNQSLIRTIFKELTEEFHCMLVFECCSDLIPMYRHIGCFYTTNCPEGLVEMYYDPFNLW